MATYHYKSEQLLPISMQSAWDFFSSAKNLAIITPPELQFKILTQQDDLEIYEGMLLEYKLKPLFGIPVYWKTLICKVDKPTHFTDKQLKGPYKKWEHTHVFMKKGNSVLMKDHIKYELPFGILGTIAHALIVRKKVENIFSFRKNILKNIFKENANTH
ncbi:MAG: SRPBCC family protein [Ginsengibacter sp.]